MNNNINKVYLGKSSNHIRYGSPLKIRLQAIFAILSGENFILIHGIKEWVADGRFGRDLIVSSVTEYNSVSDQNSCHGAAEILRRKNVDEVIKYDFPNCNHDWIPQSDSGFLYSQCTKCGAEKS